MITLRQIEVFNAIMETGSVVGAARLLNISQPVVSRVIRHLEDQTKISLFERSKGRLHPSPVAHVLFGEVSRIYRNVRSFQDSLERLAEGDNVTLRIAASPSVAADLVPRALVRLKRRFPKLVLRLDVLSVSQVSDYLVLDGGEMVVSVFGNDHPSISSQQLGSGEMVAVIPADHELASANVLRAEEMANALASELIGFERDTPHGQLVAEFLGRYGLAYQPSTIVRFAETACHMVRVGMGIALVDNYTALGVNASSIVTRRLVNAPKMGIFVHSNVERGLSSFGRQLLRCLKLEVEALHNQDATAIVPIANRQDPPNERTYPGG